MSDLVIQAEQRLLAALLARPHQRPDRPFHLEPADFSHPLHAKIYDTFLDAVEGDSWDGGPGPGERSRDEILEFIDVVTDNYPDIDLAWLNVLASTAPGPGHASEYAKIVMNAAMEREIGEWDEPYQIAAQQSTNPQARAGLERLSRILQRHNSVFNEHDDANVGRYLDKGHVVDIVGLRHMHREDVVLADLVQNPYLVKEVALWLPPEAFTAGQRRLTYEVLVPIAFDQDPVDDIILGWQVQSAHRTAQYWGGPTYQADETDAAYVTRLALSKVPPGSAVTIGRELAAQHAQTTLELTAPDVTRTVQVGPVQVGLEAPLSVAPVVESRRIEL